MQAPTMQAAVGLALAASVVSAAPGAKAKTVDQRAFAGTPAGALIAFAQDNRVFLMHGDGSDRRLLSTGSSYAWSHDGRYMLLVRGSDVLLLDAKGAVLRTLAANVGDEDFPPAWALDGDAVIYETNGASPTEHTVSMVDLLGHSTVLWRYASAEGCGGATPFAPDSLMWREVGLDRIAGGMQWSIARHLAVYSASCRGGLNVTDTRSGHTQQLSPRGAVWNEPALSSQGTLAVMAARDPGSARSIVLTSPVVGARTITVAPGELPLWSVDGRTLYFERTTAARQVQYVGADGKHATAPTNISSIWRVGANGTGPTRIYTQKTYGFGPLSPLAGSATLVFSSVDNVTSATAKHYLADGTVDSLIAAHVRVMRLDLGSNKAATVLIGAGKPQGQP